jgi:hypothetical protein
VEEWSATGSGFFIPSEEISIFVESGVFPIRVLNMAHNGEFLSLSAGNRIWSDKR